MSDIEYARPGGMKLIFPDLEEARYYWDIRQGYGWLYYNDPVTLRSRNLFRFAGLDHGGFKMGKFIVFLGECEDLASRKFIPSFEDDYEFREVSFV